MGGFPGAYAKPTGTPWAGYLEREGPASAGGEARGGAGAGVSLTGICSKRAQRDLPCRERLMEC